MTSRKGQASLEQMITTAIGIAAIIVIFVVAFGYLNDNVRSTQGRDAAFEELVQAFYAAFNALHA